MLSVVPIANAQRVSFGSLNFIVLLGLLLLTNDLSREISEKKRLCEA
jgi:hypothetical protein